MQVIPAGHAFREAALALLYGSLPANGPPQHTSQVQRGVNAGEIPLDDLLVALVDRQPVGAVLAVRRPGGMAFIWPPATRDETGFVARQLLRNVAQRLDAGGTQFAQCLLETGDKSTQRAMSDGGFPYCTDMLLLTRPVAIPSEPPAVRLSTVGYSDATHPLFVRVMENTFAGSLDCPSLTRIRRGEAALAAHRDASHFDPALWQVFHAPDTSAVGVQLCVDHPDRGVREISYLGVVPPARGRGIGRAMLCEAVAQAHLDRCVSLEVAVDAGNRHALAIYQVMEFSVARRMAVHLRLRAIAGASAE